MFDSTENPNEVLDQIQEEVQKLTTEDTKDVLKFIQRMQNPNLFNRTRRFILRKMEAVKADWIRRILQQTVDALFHIEFALFPL